jgi:diaminohydroxyphosphoribosylaminopyrimidine deaminase/5-amino-6-(5-phosphoribosylamino)uracil reductase
MFSALDCTYMAHALRLAEQGLYTTTPNPRVGCVIVKNQKIVGEGAHLKAGEPHAEVHALRQAAGAAKGADIYVTLEPCSHTGKTPPCVNAVIEAQPQRVIVAMQDPNPLVSGRGIAALRDAGIEVLVGVLEAQANALNVGFVSRMVRHTPYVRSKIAASLDGKTALENGQSQWITSAPARLDVQHWRAQSCAIISGIGTVLADDPSLSVRLPNARRQPLKVIVDSHLKTPVAAKVFQDGMALIAYAKDINHQSERLIAAGAQLLHCPNEAGQVDLKALLLALGQRGINDVMLEAGQGLNGAFLQADLVDEWLFYYAPKLLGGHAKALFSAPVFTSMQETIALTVLDVRQIGVDIRLRAKPAKPS